MEVDPPKEQLVHLFGTLEKEKASKPEVCGVVEMSVKVTMYIRICMYICMQ